MKQLMTTKTALLLVVLLTVVSSFSFAGSAGDLAPAIKNSFRQDFRNASLINSEVNEKFIKVTFSQDNTIQQAYYSKDGQLLAVVHNILSSELPAELQMELKRQFGKFWINELFELKEADSTYYVSLESADEVLNLRSTADNGWEVYSTRKKN